MSSYQYGLVIRTVVMVIKSFVNKSFALIGCYILLALCMLVFHSNPYNLDLENNVGTNTNQSNVRIETNHSIDCVIDASNRESLRFEISFARSLAKQIYDSYQCPRRLKPFIGSTQHTRSVSAIPFFNQARCNETYTIDMLTNEIINDCDKLIMNMFDPYAFIKVMANKTLYIVGDSLTEQFFTTLLCTLNLDSLQNKTQIKHYHIEVKKPQKCIDAVNIKDRNRFVNESIAADFELRTLCKHIYVRIDLNDHTFFKMIWFRNNAFMPWFMIHQYDKYLKYWNAALLNDLSMNKEHQQMVLFNTGAHWGLSHNMTLFNQTIRGFFKLFPVHFMKQHRIELIYSVNIPGYPNCHAQDVGLQHQQWSNLSIQFGWHLFQEFDKMTENAFTDTFENEKVFEILDNRRLYQNMKYGRRSTEQFTECLHFCQPGPNYWQLVLFYRNMIDTWHIED